MLEQISNNLIYHAFFTASKTGKTGLTVTVDVYRVKGDGTFSTLLTNQSAVETGGGHYHYILPAASNTVEGDYKVTFKTSDGTVDVQHLPALITVGHAGIEDLDAAISSRNAITPPTVAAIRTEIDANSTKLDAAVSSRATPGDVLAAVGGGGTSQYTHTVLNGITPLDGVAVWVTTASTSSTTGIVASGVTNTFGIVKFLLDPGTYYFWHQLRGFNFTSDPELKVVT